MSEIVICCSSRAERGPLESVIAALPEARISEFDAFGREPQDAMACALLDFTEMLRGAKLVILLGDRYETLAAALAATFLRIPIAHIHGGETTTGAFDDAFRDSITRMAALHFVATGDAAQRVAELQRCEDGSALKSNGVHIVGAPGLDGIAPNSAQRDHKRVLVTYHPETRAPDYGISGCHAMLEALSGYYPEYAVAFCGVNNDPGHEDIERLIEDWCCEHGEASIHENMSHSKYIELMQHAALCIGNSSSLVIECPWVGVPSVNIGHRQDGRPMATSVIQDDNNVAAAINYALHTSHEYKPCYHGGGVGLKIAEVVREFVRGK